MFDAFSYYKAVHGTNANSFPWKSIWHVKAPRGVSFFFFWCGHQLGVRFLLMIAMLYVSVYW